MMMQLLTYLPDFLSGLSITCILMVSSLLLGFFCAVGMTFASYANNFFIKKTIDLFIFFIRGTPLLVQLFLIYYGLGQFEFIRLSPLWVVLKEPMTCSILALAINSACYTTVLLRGAIQSVPKNEVMACEALGLSKWFALRRIIFPRALRLVMLPYSNEVIMLLKATSLASTITLLDFMGVTQQLIAQTYKTVEFYCVAACVYLAMYMLIMTVFKFLLRDKRKLSMV